MNSVLLLQLLALEVAIRFLKKAYDPLRHIKTNALVTILFTACVDYSTKIRPRVTCFAERLTKRTLYFKK